MPHPEKRDLELTARQLAVWLQARLPGARDVRIENLRGPSETGFSSDTLMLDAHWSDDGGAHVDHLVARFEPKGVLVFPSYDVGQQYRVMKILGERSDVPVPRMRWNEESEAPAGSPFYVMDQVSGRVPSDVPPYHGFGWVTDLPLPDRERLWWNGLEAMTRVSRVDWRTLGFGFLDRPDLGATPLDQQLAYYDHFFEWGVGGDWSAYPLLERTRRWLYENRPADEPVGLCWGDARLCNQMFDDDLNCVAVIDWEMVRLGNPVQDLAWWIILDRCLSEGIGINRLDGLPDRAATIARWEKLLGREARHVGYYEVLGCYKFSIIMARITLQMKHYETLPADSDMGVNNLASATLARVFAEVAA